MWCDSQYSWNFPGCVSQCIVDTMLEVADRQFKYLFCKINKVKLKNDWQNIASMKQNMIELDYTITSRIRKR